LTGARFSGTILSFAAPGFRQGSWSARDKAETEELHWIISTRVRDMLDALCIQAQAGPVGDEALEEILFRAAHRIGHSQDAVPGLGADGS